MGNHLFEFVSSGSLYDLMFFVEKKSLGFFPTERYRSNVPNSYFIT